MELCLSFPMLYLAPCLPVCRPSQPDWNLSPFLTVSETIPRLLVVCSSVSGNSCQGSQEDRPLWPVISKRHAWQWAMTQSIGKVKSEISPLGKVKSTGSLQLRNPSWNPSEHAGGPQLGNWGPLSYPQHHKLGLQRSICVPHPENELRWSYA